MNLINDGIGLLLGLAPVASLVALVLAGLALRSQGSVLQNGRFGLWMFWAAVMLTLPQILSWLSGFGMNVPISAGGGTAILNVFKVDVTKFVNQFVVGYLAPVIAAWLVLRGVVRHFRRTITTPLDSRRDVFVVHCKYPCPAARLEVRNEIRDGGRIGRPMDVHGEPYSSGRRWTGDYRRNFELCVR